ncbi:MAG: hypothetical protein ACFFBL_13740 [Promethearchaeota archaeon]
MLGNAKEDVLCSVEIWKEVLQETFGSRLDYAYTKGSALKNWDSNVDYVPVISDVDIHIMLSDSHPLFPNSSQGFTSSIEVSKMYEERFREMRGEFLHIPRSQIVHINPVLDDPSFILPQVSDVHVLLGSPTDGRIPTNEEIRTIDLNELRELSGYLADLPRQTFDRVGLDFWTLLRRMCWRVSPSPVRLLTQDHHSPLEVWKWNRTRILEELRYRKFDMIADSYQKYYETGWKLFLSGFAGFSEIRETVEHGYAVLQGCLNEVIKNQSSE